jgi:hypothetical protein
LTHLDAAAVFETMTIRNWLSASAAARTSDNWPAADSSSRSRKKAAEATRCCAEDRVLPDQAGRHAVGLERPMQAAGRYFVRVGVADEGAEAEVALA